MLSWLDLEQLQSVSTSTNTLLTVTSIIPWSIMLETVLVLPWRPQQERFLYTDSKSEGLVWFCWLCFPSVKEVKNNPPSLSLLQLCAASGQVTFPISCFPPPPLILVTNTCIYTKCCHPVSEILMNARFEQSWTWFSALLKWLWKHRKHT